MFLLLMHNILDLINFKLWAIFKTVAPHLRSEYPKYKQKAFEQFYLSLNFNFSIVCFPETWANDININKNSCFQLPNHNTEHQIRKSGRGRGLCIFIHESLNYKDKKRSFHKLCYHRISYGSIESPMVWYGIESPIESPMVVYYYCSIIYYS